VAAAETAAQPPDHPWAGRARWCTVLTGFGDGERFLSTWSAWRADPRAPPLLHVVAVEPRPVDPSRIRLSGAHPELARELAAQWWGLTPGFHRLRFDEGRVLLTLCVGELPAVLRELAFRADALSLEAATLTADVVKPLARLCRRGTCVSVMGDAAPVSEALRAAGFTLQAAAQGLVGHYAPSWPVRDLPNRDVDVQPGRCIVIGAGLAGAACAHAFAQRGWEVRVLDAADGPAQGASALPVGLLAPHQSPDDNLLSRLSRCGVRTTLQAASSLLRDGEDYTWTGVVERRLDDPRPPPNLGSALDPWTRAGEANTWHHDAAGWIRPAALVHAWLTHERIGFEGGRAACALQREDEAWRVLGVDGDEFARGELVIVAAALGSAQLMPGALPVHPVRGQVSWGPTNGTLPCATPVNGNGHFIPNALVDGSPAWLTGSTYGRGDADSRPRDEDHGANLERMGVLVPDVAEVLAARFTQRQVNAWSGVRCASRDRRPLVGLMAPGLGVCTAMGSRGLTFAALSAELLAAQVHGEPWPLERRLGEALAANR